MPHVASFGRCKDGGKLDETVDFSSGEVSVEEIVRKYGAMVVCFIMQKSKTIICFVDEYIL